MTKHLSHTFEIHYEFICHLNKKKPFGLRLSVERCIWNSGIKVFHRLTFDHWVCILRNDMLFLYWTNHASVQHNTLTDVTKYRNETASQRQIHNLWCPLQNYNDADSILSFSFFRMISLCEWHIYTVTRMNWNNNNVICIHRAQRLVLVLSMQFCELSYSIKFRIT